MQRKREEEIGHYYNLDIDLNNFFSSFVTKEESSNYEDINNSLEEKLFYINPIKNRLNKKEINYNQKNTCNKIQFNKNIKSQNEVKNKKDNNNYIQIFKVNISSNVEYRKDAYYKFFKSLLGRYIKNKINTFKNKCFPFYCKNNFSPPNYKYTGNPKEKDNFKFLSFRIKDIMIYGKNKAKFNRQYNNELIINFIEENEDRAKDKDAYKQLIKFLNETLEDAIIQFYDDEKEFTNKIKNNFKFIYLDKFYKRETGISLLEKYGFLKVLKKYDKNKSKQNMDILHKNL